MERENIVVTYKLEFQLETPKRAIELLLAEMTSGIQYVSTREGVRMDPVQDSVPYVDEKVQGETLSVEELDDASYRVTYAIPLHNLDVGLGGITNLWPMIAGEVFNFHFIKKATLVEVDLPLPFIDHYLGPQFGIEGVRELIEVKRGPLFGSIIKPNLGLDPPRSAHTVEILAKAGFDFIKDDEICVNSRLCPLEERVSAIAQRLYKVQQQKGTKVLYAANVTSDFATLGKAAEIAIQSGAGALMIDPFCTGFSGIDFLRRNFNAPIYAHRVGYGIFCSGPSYSIRYEVFTGLFRLLGADFSHVGGIWGKSEAAKQTTSGYLDILKSKSQKNPAWPVVTGISIENMKEYYDFYGENTMFMDHIDIYSDEESAGRKLQALKERLG
jgi:ribulose 1,5-bisphosphate carboxylase large subunit-like protein